MAGDLFKLTGHKSLFGRFVVVRGFFFTSLVNSIGFLLSLLWGIDLYKVYWIIFFALSSYLFHKWSNIMFERMGGRVIISYGETIEALGDEEYEW